MFLDDVKKGATVFIDANIFVYHFSANSAFNQSCTEFFYRVEAGDVRGITSAAIVQEATHRLMIEEAALVLPDVKAKDIIKHLKTHPEITKKLSIHRAVPGKVMLFTTEIVPLDMRTIEKSQSMKSLYGVLSNDALILQLMKDQQIDLLASNDGDFEKVDFITLYKPS